MLFNTIQFAVFYVVVVAVYFAVPHRFRWPLLLAASYYFYMCWSVRYLSVILAITLIDYYAGLKIEAANGPARRRYLALSVVCNFGLLFVFKYADFFSTTINSVLLRLNVFGSIPLLRWILPVGISFHTFQAVSYTFDVYRGKARAERHLGMYALYVAFFPQMVAGPIERPNNLLPQFRERKELNYLRFASGLRTALWGLIKKCIVADLAAAVVNTVYSRPQAYSGSILCLATVLFAVQIYCDFSGYSDIAIGIARVMGYDLMINFRQPYFAESVAEFWHRWHISLSTWFRDYVYIPLGGNRVAVWRWWVNILIVFLLSGLWHGANWTFVVWGALHGLFIVSGSWTKGPRRRMAELSGLSRLPRVQKLVRIFATGALVTFAWVFFRAATVSDGVFIALRLWRLQPVPLENLFRLGLPRFEMTLLFLATAFVFTCEYLRQRPSMGLEVLWNNRGVRWAACAAGVYAVVFFGVFERVEFIYFQF